MNITLKTIEKVKDAICNADILVSANHIAQSENINGYCVKTAIKQLLQSGYIKKIENSTGIDLYTKNES